MKALQQFTNRWYVLVKGAFLDQICYCGRNGHGWGEMLAFAIEARKTVKSLS